MKIESKVFNINNNISNRIYTKESLKEAIANWKNENDINSHLGQLNTISHNEYNELNIQNVSHKVDDITIHDNAVYCKLTPLELKNGRILASIIDEEKPFKPCIWFSPCDWEYYIDDNGYMVVTKCKIDRIDVSI